MLLLREFIGHPEGLCHGMGGHMHLFTPKLLVASSGIVGAAGPAARNSMLRIIRPPSVLSMKSTTISLVNELSPMEARCRFSPVSTVG